MDLDTTQLLSSLNVKRIGLKGRKWKQRKKLGMKQTFEKGYKNTKTTLKIQNINMFMHMIVNMR